MKKTILTLCLTCIGYLVLQAQKEPVDYVNPFIGSTNFGTTNPGALQPQGLMSVTPFNVMGSDLNPNDKDARWWSTPYGYENKYFTGFSHVNLSGVGCPDMGSLLLMATTGNLEVDYHKYGSEYKNEIASPGYYSNFLTKYNIKTEVTATPRVGLTQFTFPKGEGNILLNLGEGLTNETGATVRRVNDREIEGSKLLGTFCYTASQAVYPLYFVVRVNKTPKEVGYWKFQRPGQEWENEWNTDAGKYKIYKGYNRELSGDDIGAFFTFETTENETIDVQVAVSFVSIENARLNLETEQPTADFDAIHQAARDKWNEDLSRILVEGGTDEQKTVFYTALYHALIHPNILQDVNGEYPAMETLEVKHTDGNRYTVFSLWDTYRNVHQLMTLVYPERQIQMMNSMVDMYKEGGWLPKWELYSRESYTMEGDPAIPVLVDAWFKGLKDFDVEAAYEAMYKSATTPGKENKIRPDNDDYMNLGYVPLRGEYDNSVSHALEYYIADWNLARFAEALGKKKDAEFFYKKSLGYKNYYDKETGIFRPKLPNGQFITPFNPAQGMDFEPNPGFHEGCAWNYAFAVPHDIPGLVKLMGGEKKFTERLQSVFDNVYYDVTNEPDINYPHFFSNIKGEEWRTQKIVKDLLNEHYRNAPDGLPGNDDLGTLSTWALFNMMGFYPETPGRPDYTLTSPVFDKVTIKLNPQYYSSDQLVITKTEPSNDSTAIYIDKLEVDGKTQKRFHITHDELTNAKELNYIMKKDK